MSKQVLAYLEKQSTVNQVDCLLDKNEFPEHLFRFRGWHMGKGILENCLQSLN